jgi:hypothetical protein
MTPLPLPPTLHRVKCYCKRSVRLSINLVACVIRTSVCSNFQIWRLANYKPPTQGTTAEKSRRRRRVCLKLCPGLKCPCVLSGTAAARIQSAQSLVYGKARPEIQTKTSAANACLSRVGEYFLDSPTGARVRFERQKLIVARDYAFNGLLRALLAWRRTQSEEPRR